MTSVHAERYVACPFSAGIEYAEEALRQRPGMIVSPGSTFGEPITLETAIADDLTDPARRHDALLLAWQPMHAAYFPDFRGALTVRPQMPGSWLRIQGCYEPPGGLFGRAFDAVAGRFIAAMTLRRLLDQIGRAVEAKWAAIKETSDAFNR